MRNIQEVSDNALCTACGACCGICPTQVISMETNAAGYLLATVEVSGCIDCGMCYDICPSNPENTPGMDKNDIFHGKYLRGYIGHATDKEIRQKSQSGGIVTALLCYMLDKQLVEGAVVNNINTNTNRPQAVFAKTKKEIIKGQGSYYSQSAVVKTILENKDKKLAAVVLGCQSESLKNINNKNPKIKLPAYNIGLFCAGQHSGKFIDELIVKSGCNKNDVTDFRFRDKDAGGWPGNIKIYTENESYVMNQKVRHELKKVYENYRCLLCFDQMNIFSDVCVGDPWGIERNDNKEGNTVIIARTQKGKKLIEDAEIDGVISTEELSVKKIIEGQTVDGRLKTQYFTAKEVSKKNGYIHPYNEKSFEGISHVKPTLIKNQEIKRRLRYSRMIYLKKSINTIKNLVLLKKLELMVTRFFGGMVINTLKHFGIIDNQ